MEFIQILESLQTGKNKFKCYKPVKEEGNTAVLELTSDLVFSPRQKMEDIRDNASEVSVDNTCRHPGVESFKTRHAPPSSLVSSVFLMELPYTTRLDYGVPSPKIPFYVLPLSPTAFPDLDEEKRAILFKLYSRMEHLLLIDTRSPQTQNKFRSLKSYITRSQDHKKI